jgi:hypothetical protein
MGNEKSVTENYGESLLKGKPLSSERWFYFGMEGDRVPFILEK